MTLSGLGETAQNALWVVFFIQGIAAVVFSLSAYRLPAEKRDHFLVTAAIVATASVSYYAMATGLGHVDILIGPKKEAVTRSIFYARYIDWSVTTPLLLVDVLLMTKLPLTTAFWVIFSDLAMVVTGLIGGLAGDQFRWGWFVIGTVAMLFIFYTLFVDGAKGVEKRDSNLLPFYNSVILGLIVLWTAYPIVWALGEGTQYISSDVEAYLYAILDVLAKVGWGGFIVYNNDMLQTSYSKGLSDAEAPLVQA